eukprot:PLAT6615.1.p1 GENE.PLAT6615.1~~PLAT6615.1.p1  ORF type:complete len:301 (+),score=98.57 PLAT6615.1:277-1179(+)
MMSQREHDQLVAFLIEKGARPAPVNAYLLTPLHYACSSRRVGAAAILIGCGVDVNARDNYGNTPLHAAADRQEEELLSLLILAGANVNIVNNAGKTPLHLVAARKEEGSTNWRVLTSRLMAAGALLTAEDEEGGRIAFDAEFVAEARWIHRGWLLMLWKGLLDGHVHPDPMRGWRRRRLRTEALLPAIDARESALTTAGLHDMRLHDLQELATQLRLTLGLVRQRVDQLVTLREEVEVVAADEVSLEGKEDEAEDAERLPLPPAAEEVTEEGRLECAAASVVRNLVYLPAELVRLVLSFY